MIQKTIYFLTLLCINTIAQSVQISLSQEEINPQQKTLLITFHLDSDETILKQTLKITSDSPHAKLSGLSFSQTAIKQYLPEFKDSKELFDQSFTVTTTATCQTTDHVKTQLYICYLPLPSGKMEEKTFDLDWNIDDLQTPLNQDRASQKYHPTEPRAKKSYLESLQHLVQTTDNPWVRLLLIFLLGLFLSLTPCIYPMIPITIGILHRNGKKSLLHNFLGSLCYAIGLATTFAIMGLLAALAGASFGNLLSQPIFVLILTIFIGFMSLSMIGLVDMPMPSFMKSNTTVNSAYGPFLSAFLFGLLSGSIASPCVSPGLALVLTIVATIGNVLAGFWLLFAFGIGMSVPLVIIGTFSTSLQMLPQAGQWMVEVKKILGFIMLATCFYYLSNILPAAMIMWLLVAYLLFAALFYIMDAQKSFDPKSKTIKSLVGIILLAITIFVGYRTYVNRSTLSSTQEGDGVLWAENYEAGLSQAKQQHKLVILDFWATHCTLCKAIDKRLFHTAQVAQGLEDYIVFIKVDCSSSHNHEASHLKHKFGVIGQPAILILNPEDETVLKQWSSEPYNMKPQEFINAVKQIKA